MRTHTFFLAAVFTLLTALRTASGQGCSDAGFCSMHGLEPDLPDTAAVRDNDIMCSASNGGADHGITVWNFSLEYSRNLGNRFGASVKLTYQAIDGPLAQTSGLADVYAGVGYEISEEGLLTIGLKLPLHDGNATSNGLPLPMDYQPGLGTTDLIAGIAYDIGGVQAAVAIQQPLAHNSNSFIATAYPADSEFRQFQSTNAYRRKGDILLRASDPIHVAHELVITPGLLPVYHVANDTYTDADGNTRIIDGSQGLTLNGTLLVYYASGESSGLLLSFGTPFLTRTSRADGLTRSYVVALEYRFGF